MNKYSDQTERKLIVRFFSSIGSIATLSMAFLSFLESGYFLSAVLFISAFIYIWAFSIYKKVEKSATVILYNLYATMVYLILTGGVEGTGPIWIFIVSSVTYSIRGFKRGTFDIILFLLTVMLGFYCAEALNIHDYEPDQFPYRIVLAFIIVALLSGYYEYSRGKYSNKIIALSKKNEFLATIDPLTGLPNRRYTMAKLVEFKNQLNLKQTPFVILLADVDNFKKVNDKYGHDFGDEALVHLAKVFKQSISQQAIASRWGGEEFLIIIPNTKIAEGRVVAKKIHTTLSNSPVNMFENSVKLTLSMGLIQSERGCSIDLDIKHADELLYKAKEQGKDKTCSA
jgi:diguanylate cyclase (GGDEF)-like protein